MDDFKSYDVHGGAQADFFAKPLKVPLLVAGSGKTVLHTPAAESESVRERLARGTEPAAALHARIVRASNPSHPGHNWVRDNWVAEARCPWDNWKPSKDIAC